MPTANHIDDLGADLPVGDVLEILQSPQTTAEPSNKLDDDVHTRLLGVMRDWRREEGARQKPNRYRQAIEMDFVDHIQWSEEDSAVLQERGQAPLVFNRMALAIRWIIGTHIKARLDWHILPRTPEDDEIASVKTKVFKYISDTARVPYATTAAFKDAAKIGVGWVEIGISPDPTQPLIYCNHISWRNVWIDSRGRDPDYNRDGRYIIVEKVLDLDIAVATWPARAHVVRRSVETGANRDDDEFNDELIEDADSVTVGRYVSSGTWTAVQNPRQRVRVTECWYKVPRQCKVLKGGPLHGLIYDPNSSVQTLAIAQGDSKVVKAFKMVMRKAVWCSGGLLEEGPSPYRHNRFPYIPVFCFRRDRDNMPYGHARGMVDAQEDYNQRASRALFRLATNQVHYEEGAFVDDDVALKELRRPDGNVEFKRGQIDRAKIINDLDKVQGDLEMMNRDAQHIEAIGGVRNETMNVTSADMSGRALRTLEDMANTTNAELTDNHRLFFKQCGEIVLSLVEQFMTEEDIIRITDEDMKPEWVPINRPQWDAVASRWTYQNDVTASQADFIVAEQDFRNSVRESMFETLVDLVSKLPPEMGMQLLDIAISIHPDVPQRREVLSRVRKIAGIPDPESKKTPEEEAAEAKKAEDAARMSEAEIQKAEGEAAKLRAQAEELAAKVAKLATDGKKVDADAVSTLVTAIYTAMQAGQVVATVPQVTPAADQILQAAGFKDAGGGGLDTTDAPIMPAPESLQPGTWSVSTKEPPGAPGAPIQPPLQTDGAAAGIETPVNDGVVA